MPWFGHSGDLGDVIYSLPTIKAMGGGTLYLYLRPGKTWHGMDAEKVASLRSLLVAQPYIEDVIFCPEGRPPWAADHNLNGFRDHGGPGRNLADMHLATHGLDSAPRHDRWLEVDRPIAAARVVFARSERCRNAGFPWRRVWERYRDAAGFVGTAAEHEDFCRSVGPVPLIPTPDLLEVARMIAGSQLFVGNQSCPAAIAEGLKQAMILEVYPPLPNCCFERLGRINAWGDGFELPVLVR